MTENLKNHTLFRGTYLYSPYMGVPHPHPPRVILVLARFKILDHCIFLSNKNHTRLPKVPEISFFVYFRDKAAIVSGKATYQSQRVWILCNHFLLQVINLDRGYRSFTTKKKPSWTQGNTS